MTDCKANDLNNSVGSEKVRAQKIVKLDEEIARFDSVLDHIQKLVPEDLQVCKRIVTVREAMWFLHNQVHGLEVVHFCDPNGGDPV